MGTPDNANDTEELLDQLRAGNRAHASGHGAAASSTLDANVLLLTCSDLGVVPETIFNQPPNTLLVQQTAGVYTCADENAKGRGTAVYEALEKSARAAVNGKGMWEDLERVARVHAERMEQMLAAGLPDVRVVAAQYSKATRRVEFF